MCNEFSSIVIPMIRRDVPELYDLFSVLPDPGLGKKIELFITLDLNFDRNLQSEISANFMKNQLDRWFDLSFIDCGMTAQESIYIRKYFDGFDRAANPFGMKSGPNVQFFRSMRFAMARQKRKGCILLLETDITPLAPGWLTKIAEELPEPSTFLVAGPAYTGGYVLTKEIRDHVNGASVYNSAHPEFPKYLDLWEMITRLGCVYVPWQAYDTMPEWLTFNMDRFKEHAERAQMSEFVSLYRSQVVKISSIANLSGPTERDSPDKVADNLFWGKASLHLRAPLPVRQYWQNLVQGNWQNLRVEDVAVNRHWQYPAITEQHAFEKMRKCRIGNDIMYFAFPWATLFDQLMHKPEDAKELLADLNNRSAFLKQFATVVTVCQHVHMREFLDIMSAAGITDVFWSHTTRRDVMTRSALQIKLYPFPLYPVQFPELSDPVNEEGLDRPVLFSFIGSYSPQYYLSQSRNHIINDLQGHPKGNVVERREWHYNNVVYNHQILGKTAQGGELVDNSKSTEFRASLLQSTFSLCPSGSGPNSIRLWESLGAGSIPVILADTWAPPGNSRLWEMAAVFCKESREDIRALPDRLADIAADPARLARMRHAMRQLWILYGPQGFVTDIKDWMHSAAAGKAGTVGARPESAPGGTLPGKIRSSDDSRTLLNFTTELLLDPAGALTAANANTAIAADAMQARGKMPEDARLARHFDAVLPWAMRKSGLNFPMVARGSRPRVTLLGRHSHRTPMSYETIRRSIGDDLVWEADPGKADLIVTGFNIDIGENASTLLPLLDGPRPPRLAIFSEEPLWDVTWSGPFTGRTGRTMVKDREICYTVINHETSSVYDFQKIPYFVLSENHYAVRYASLMARFAGVTPADLIARWKVASIRAAFFAEKRSGATYAGTFADRDVARLSAYRTDVATALQGEGTLCVGAGWGDKIRRQDLPDWHLDKLAQLDGRVFVVSSFENVHQHRYISEKAFDAFAVGGIPTYWASPQHRIFDLIPEEAMVNTHRLSAEEAARRIGSFQPDADFVTAWLGTAARLSAVFGDDEAVQAERRRVAKAVVQEVYEVV